MTEEENIQALKEAEKKVLEVREMQIEMEKLNDKIGKIFSNRTPFEEEYFRNKNIYM